jgi:hypothetical protein
MVRISYNLEIINYIRVTLAHVCEDSINELTWYKRT